MMTKIAAAFVLVFALSACSGGDDTSSTPKPTASSSAPTDSESAKAGNPPCADIWKDGATLAKGYHGCAKKDSQEESVRCEDGTALVVWNEMYFAITGGKITKSSVSPLQDTEAYGKAYSTCTGE